MTAVFGTVSPDSIFIISLVILRVNSRSRRLSATVWSSWPEAAICRSREPKDEARRMAANFAKLPELLRRRGSNVKLSACLQWSELGYSPCGPMAECIRSGRA